MEEKSARIDESAPIWKYYQQEEDMILDFCAKNYISCFLQGDALVVETSISIWKIITNGQKKKMFLYHRNDINTDVGDDSDSLVPRFHSQSCRRNSIVEYLEYIVAHDIYRENNPAYYSKAAKPKPQKGTKRYRKELKKAKKRKQREASRRVLELIEQMEKDHDLE